MSLDCGAALQSGGRVLSRASTFDSQLTCNYSISQRVFFDVASLAYALSDVVRSILMLCIFVSCTCMYVSWMAGVYILQETLHRLQCVTRS